LKSSAPIAPFLDEFPKLLLGLTILLAIAVPERAAFGQQAEPAVRPVVLQIRLDNESINPVTARYIERAIRDAEQQQVECLVLMLDTPGGLVDATRRIVREILNSTVPVVVYVAPSGARAASAGVFITLAGHVAAMAPGTNIGAAHPVSIGGLPSAPPQEDDQQTDDDDDAPRRRTPAEAKIVNDTVAWARSLAELRGRNADWAESTVRESVSVPASEAVAQQAVDFLADDMRDLLAQLDGREVVVGEETVRLRTAGAEVRLQEMWWGDRLLTRIANPNLAFLLLILGFYGILFELYSPGWGVGGTLGIISLLLAFMAMAVLPINYIGLALLAVGLGLLVAEVFVTSYGALTVGGLACMVMGGLILVDSPTGFQRVSLEVVIPVAAATGLVTAFLVHRIVRAHGQSVQTGNEALTSSPAVALGEFRFDGQQYVGPVRIRGEIWRAVSSQPVTTGQPLEVDERRGLLLQVHPSETPSVPPEAGDSEQQTKP
jgi:membrane-bound serine protease (ClpP class)